MIHHPQRGRSNPCWEHPDLDAVELVHVDTRQARGVQFALPSGTARGAQIPNDVDFQLAQLAVGNDEEVAAAACRVKNRQFA